MYQCLPFIIIMKVAKFIVITFLQIELECFQKDIVGEHVDSHPWVELACTSLLGSEDFCTFFDQAQVSSRDNIVSPVGALDGLH